MDLEPLKDAWWGLVADCLREFHGYSRVTARTAALDLRRDLEAPDAPSKTWGFELLTYHAEPFHVACDLARRDLPLERFRDRYFRLMELRYGPTEARAGGDGLRRTG